MRTIKVKELAKIKYFSVQSQLSQELHLQQLQFASVGQAASEVFSLVRFLVRFLVQCRMVCLLSAGLLYSSCTQAEIRKKCTKICNGEERRGGGK